MSTLKMVLHYEKTLKTNTQKNLSKSQKFARKVSAAESCYSQTNFLWFTVILFMILKIMILQDFILKLSESGGIPVVELFCGNIQRVKAVGYFRRRAPTWMLDRILNVTLPNNLL